MLPGKPSAEVRDQSAIPMPLADFGPGVAPARNAAVARPDIDTSTRAVGFRAPVEGDIISKSDLIGDTHPTGCPRSRHIK
jgi:hypothetical protein